MQSGTIRTNLDPFGEHTDLELWSALKRAYLVPSDASIPKQGEAPAPSAGRFGLETQIDEDGSNLSVGGECSVGCLWSVLR